MGRPSRRLEVGRRVRTGYLSLVPLANGFPQLKVITSLYPIQLSQQVGSSNLYLLSLLTQDSTVASSQVPQHPGHTYIIYN